MLDPHRKGALDVASYTGAGETDGETFSPVPLQLASLWRHKRLIGYSLLVGLLIALAIVAIRPRSYTSISRLLIDNRNLQLSNKDAIYASSAVDLPFVQNQLELLRSEKVALQVIDRLQLTEDKEFVKPRWSLFGGPSSSASAAKGAPGYPEPSDELTFKRRQALQYLQTNIFIGRVGESFTLEVRFTSRDPAKAARVANAIVDAYLQDQIAANEQAAQSATAWLRDRIRGLGPHARVITEAAPAIKPDGPGSLSILAASAVASVLFGVGLAFARDLADRGIRQPGQAAAVAGGAECFGVVATIPSKGRSNRSPPKPGQGGQSFSSAQSPFPLGLTDPMSTASQTMSRLKTAVIREQAGFTRSIGVTSALPGEGKTTVAWNFAVALTQAGKRVLLVDTDLYNPDLSCRVAPGATAGLVEVLNGTGRLSNAVWRDTASTLQVLPLGGSPPGPLPDVIWSQSLDAFLETAAAEYDYVIFDLPPLAPVSDVRAASHILDAFVLVIRWGSTTAEVVDEGLSSSGPAKAKLIGTVLNNADPRALRRFGYRLPTLPQGKSCTTGPTGR